MPTLKILLFLRVAVRFQRVAITKSMAEWPDGTAAGREQDSAFGPHLVVLIYYDSTSAVFTLDEIY